MHSAGGADENKPIELLPVFDDRSAGQPRAPLRGSLHMHRTDDKAETISLSDDTSDSSSSHHSDSASESSSDDDDDADLNRRLETCSRAADLLQSQLLRSASARPSVMRTARPHSQQQNVPTAHRAGKFATKRRRKPTRSLPGNRGPRLPLIRDRPGSNRSAGALNGGIEKPTAGSKLFAQTLPFLFQMQ